MTQNDLTKKIFGQMCAAMSPKEQKTKTTVRGYCTPILVICVSVIFLGISVVFLGISEVFSGSLKTILIQSTF